MPALKTAVAFTLLKYRATAYTAMFDVTKPPIDEVDHSMSDRPRSSAFALVQLLLLILDHLRIKLVAILDARTTSKGSTYYDLRLLTF